MKILKYIINEKKIPIIFSTDIVHSDILSTGLSAGFLSLNFDGMAKKFTVTCYGESISLKIQIAKDDESLIEDFLNNEFYTFIE